MLSVCVRVSVCLHTCFITLSPQPTNGFCQPLIDYKDRQSRERPTHVHMLLSATCTCAAAVCLLQVWIILELCTGGTLLDAAVGGRFKAPHGIAASPAAPAEGCGKMEMVSVALAAGCGAVAAVLRATIPGGRSSCMQLLVAELVRERM